MRRVLAASAAFLLFATPVLAQSAGGGAPVAVQGTNAVQTCGPVTKTLAALNASVTLACPGASNYLVQLVTTPGQSALVGTFLSSDPTTGGSRRVIKTGVGPLEVASVPLTGNQGANEYRTVSGGYGEQISLTAYTSGSVDVTIIATYQTTSLFINGPVHDQRLSSMFEGNAFNVGTGKQANASGSFLQLYIQNPSTSNYRMVFFSREYSCDTLSASQQTFWFGIKNPSSVTSSPAFTAATSVNQLGNGVADPTATASFNVVTTNPATTANVANPIGVALNGGYYDNVSYATLDPGQSLLNWVAGTASGLTSGVGNTAVPSNCAMLFHYFRQPLN